jgi:hypothetical protein
MFINILSNHYFASFNLIISDHIKLTWGVFMEYRLNVEAKLKWWGRPAIFIFSWLPVNEDWAADWIVRNAFKIKTVDSEC